MDALLFFLSPHWEGGPFLPEVEWVRTSLSPSGMTRWKFLTLAFLYVILPLSLPPPSRTIASHKSSLSEPGLPLVRCWEAELNFSLFSF